MIHTLGGGATVDYNSAKDEYYAELVSELGDEEALKGGKLPAVPTREEVRQILEVAEPGRDAMILRLFYATGIRLAELTARQFCDIFYSERTIFIRSGKEDKDRYVCADPKTFEMLRAWQGDQGPDVLIFDVSDRQVQRIVDKYGEMTGISQKYEAMGRSFSPHSFRHAFATHCAENGMDLFTLKKLMGHAFLETTELYVATSMEKARKEYEGSHELMGW